MGVTWSVFNISSSAFLLHEQRALTFLEVGIGRRVCVAAAARAAAHDRLLPPAAGGHSHGQDEQRLLFCREHWALLMMDSRCNGPSVILVLVLEVKQCLLKSWFSGIFGLVIFQKVIFTVWAESPCLPRSGRQAMCARGCCRPCSRNSWLTASSRNQTWLRSGWTMAPAAPRTLSFACNSKVESPRDGPLVIELWSKTAFP